MGGLLYSVAPNFCSWVVNAAARVVDRHYNELKDKWIGFAGGLGE